MEEEVPQRSMRSHKRKQENPEEKAENEDKIENRERSEQGQKRDRKGRKIGDSLEEPEIFEESEEDVEKKSEPKQEN